jgi:hypothetical protein
MPEAISSIERQGAEKAVSDGTKDAVSARMPGHVRGFRGAPAADLVRDIPAAPRPISRGGDLVGPMLLR